MKLFTHHPKATGETYFQHLRYASFNGMKLVYSGLACIIHSVFPFLFTQTASKTVADINQQMMIRTIKSNENRLNDR